MGFGEGLVFEDSSLAADWDIAVRMMEEISRADHKLKRTGAIKVKRGSEGSTDPSKDEIGRSFSSDCEARPNNERTRLAELTPENLDNEENESEMDYSTAASLESLGYEST